VFIGSGVMWVWHIGRWMLVTELYTERLVCFRVEWTRWRKPEGLRRVYIVLALFLTLSIALDEVNPKRR
jgi:hypothetical protein